MAAQKTSNSRTVNDDRVWVDCVKSEKRVLKEWETTYGSLKPKPQFRPDSSSLFRGRYPVTTSGQIGHVVEVPEDYVRSLASSSTSSLRDVSSAKRREPAHQASQLPAIGRTQSASAIGRLASVSHTSIENNRPNHSLNTSSSNTTNDAANNHLTPNRPTAPVMPARSASASLYRMTKSGLYTPTSSTRDSMTSLITRLQGPTEHRKVRSGFDPRMAW